LALAARHIDRAYAILVACARFDLVVGPTQRRLVVTQDYGTRDPLEAAIVHGPLDVEPVNEVRLRAVVGRVAPRQRDVVVGLLLHAWIGRRAGQDLGYTHSPTALLVRLLTVPIQEDDAVLVHRALGPTRVG